MTNRPYTICHIVSSVDGKIDGDWFAAPEVRAPLMESNRIRAAYDAKAVLYGATTMAETYAEGFVDALPPAAERYPRTDWLAPTDVDGFFIAVDPKGSIAYESGHIEKKGRAKVHVIEVLLESVSDAYLAYLREKSVSYLFAGEDHIDPALVMQKLHDLLGIEKLLICGGGIVDYTFLQAGLIDELSLVIVPLTDGGVQVATVFDKSPFVPESPAIAFELLEATALPGNTVYLRYKPKNII